MPRRHYAWTVLALCFFAILCAQGVRLSFGAFVRPWEDAFGVSRGAVTAIGSLSFLIYGGSQPFVGRAVDRFGIRPEDVGLEPIGGPHPEAVDANVERTLEPQPVGLQQLVRSRGFWALGCRSSSAA